MLLKVIHIVLLQSFDIIVPRYNKKFLDEHDQ